MREASLRIQSDPHRVQNAHNTLAKGSEHRMTRKVQYDRLSVRQNDFECSLPQHRNIGSPPAA